jgi:hypothetical protein
MWNEILNNGGTLALIGVVVGFLLSEVSSTYKRCKDRSSAKIGLLDEVCFNYKQTKNKIDILAHAVTALSDKKFLSTKCTKYSTLEFEHLYHIALPKLNQLEKDNYRHLNGFYLTIDRLLDGFDESFKGDLDNMEARSTNLDTVYKAGIVQLENIKSALELSLGLSSNLLGGNPLEIFNESNV